jgi:hypothetical protein
MFLDCVTDAKYGCMGCDGGFEDQVFQYMMDIGGALVEEVDYRYEPL